MKLSPAQKTALFRALHCTMGARERWANAPRLDDGALNERISEAFGIQGGYAGRDCSYDYSGGKRPWIKIEVPGEAPVELDGRELLAAVREALGVRAPDELL